VFVSRAIPAATAATPITAAAATRSHATRRDRSAVLMRSELLDLKQAIRAV
jgi:hypothetical protein